MELVNPLGRDLGASAQPRACYCATDGGSTAAENFVTGKGTDSCANCGCYCETAWGVPYNTGQYRSVATDTNRVSEL